MKSFIEFCEDAVAAGVANSVANVQGLETEPVVRKKTQNLFLTRKKKVVTEGFDETMSKAMYNRLGYTFDFSEFHRGMQVELEHKDITKSSPVLTAKIVAAHLKENPKYYTALKKHVE